MELQSNISLESYFAVRIKTWTTANTRQILQRRFPLKSSSRINDRSLPEVITVPRILYLVLISSIDWRFHRPRSHQNKSNVIHYSRASELYWVPEHLRTFRITRSFMINHDYIYHFIICELITYACIYIYIYIIYTYS